MGVPAKLEIAAKCWARREANEIRGVVVATVLEQCRATVDKLHEIEPAEDHMERFLTAWLARNLLTFTDAYYRDSSGFDNGAAGHVEDTAERQHVPAQHVLRPRKPGDIEAEPPQHPFEVRISIGGETWDYVRRALKDLAEYVTEREPEHCGMCSGGAGGSHSLTVVQRDITAEAFRKELEQWRQNLKK